MRCIECKLLVHKADGFHCPVHPEGKHIDMYTDAGDCRANEWYPRYLTDRLKAAGDSALELDVILSMLYEVITRVRTYTGYGNLMANELETVYRKFSNRQKVILDDMEELMNTQERLYGNDKHNTTNER